MRQPESDSDESGKPEFQKIVDGFLLQPGLPFATVVTAEKVNRIFAKLRGLFGGKGIYNTAVVLWAFLGQVLRDGKEAACQATVAGIISYCLQAGEDAPTEDTGDYCRARAKLSEPAIRELSSEIANEAEHQANELYGYRWSAELDLRSIKSQLNLAHVRCKSPEMVRVEFRTTFLAYNLIRLTAASAALRSQQKPRSISFTSTCQFVLAGWAVHASDLMAPIAMRHESDELLKRIARCRVGDRPGRLEPRVLKRRRHGYPLMQKPREVLRAELRKHCT